MFNAEGEHYDPSAASAILLGGVAVGISAGGLIIVERAISSLVVSSAASAAPLLRWLPQRYVRSSLSQANWQAGKMQERTAARGGGV